VLPRAAQHTNIQTGTLGGNRQPILDAFAICTKKMKTPSKKLNVLLPVTVISTYLQRLFI
jgi:hypothetical protein